MNNASMIQGNLALALPACKPTPSFSVVSGGAPVVRSVVYESPRTIDSRFALRSFAAIALIIALAAAVFAIGSERAAAQAALASSLSFEEVKVGPGDSLWALASEHAVEGISTNEMVQIILEENDLEEGMLYPGQTLRVAS